MKIVEIEVESSGKVEATRNRPPYVMHLYKCQELPSKKKNIVCVFGCKKVITLICEKKARSVKL